MTHEPTDGSHLANEALSTLLSHVAARAPSPGAGPVAAWTCALSAALLEMVAAVAIAHGDDTGEAERRGVRARELRLRALELADADVLAYRRVMDTLARRTEPGHGQRLREALSAAADPPLEIAGIAAEVARHAADSVAGARGGIRGEAITSAVLAEAVVRVARGVVEMNLGGQAGDPRLARVAALADSAAADLARATGARRSA